MREDISIQEKMFNPAELVKSAKNKDLRWLVLVKKARGRLFDENSQYSKIAIQVKNIKKVTDKIMQRKVVGIKTLLLDQVNHGDGLGKEGYSLLTIKN